MHCCGSFHRNLFLLIMLVTFSKYKMNDCDNFVYSLTVARTWKNLEYTCTQEPGVPLYCCFVIFRMRWCYAMTDDRNPRLSDADKRKVLEGSFWTAFVKWCKSNVIRGLCGLPLFVLLFKINYECATCTAPGAGGDGEKIVFIVIGIIRRKQFIATVQCLETRLKCYIPRK